MQKSGETIYTAISGPVHALNFSLFICSGFMDSTPLAVFSPTLSTGLWNEMLSLWLLFSFVVLKDKYPDPINYLNSLSYTMAIVMVLNSEISILV